MSSSTDKINLPTINKRKWRYWEESEKVDEKEVPIYPPGHPCSGGEFIPDEYEEQDEEDGDNEEEELPDEYIDEEELEHVNALKSMFKKRRKSSNEALVKLEVEIMENKNVIKSLRQANQELEQTNKLMKRRIIELEKAETKDNEIRIQNQRLMQTIATFTQSIEQLK
jgi:hypothetical protein